MNIINKYNERHKGKTTYPLLGNGISMCSASLIVSNSLWPHGL